MGLLCVVWEIRVFNFCTAGQQDKLKERWQHHVPPCIKKLSKQLCKWIIFKESWRKEPSSTRASRRWRPSRYRELDMGQGKQKSLWLVPSIWQLSVRKNNCPCSKTVLVRVVEKVSFLQGRSQESALKAEGVQFARKTARKGTANKRWYQCLIRIWEKQ